MLYLRHGECGQKANGFGSGFQTSLDLQATRQNAECSQPLRSIRGSAETSSDRDSALHSHMQYIKHKHSKVGVFDISIHLSKTD